MSQSVQEGLSLVVSHSNVPGVRGKVHTVYVVEGRLPCWPVGHAVKRVEVDQPHRLLHLLKKKGYSDIVADELKQLTYLASDSEQLTYLASDSEKLSS